METQNCYFKNIESSDIEYIFRGLSDPAITRFYDVHFPTLEATREQMEWYDSLVKNETGIWWGIYDKSNQNFCGAGGFNNWDKNHKKAEVGFWLLKEYWGKGIMKETMPRIFDYGFSDMDLNRIEGYVVSDNIKCKNALGKINFTYEGTMRECEYKNNEKISVDIYSLLKNEWMK